MSTRVWPLPGNPNLLLGAYDLATLGYDVKEFVVAGVAKSYATDETADYTTRIVVCRPDGADFNGTAIVEWLNVSGGIDAPAVWFMAHREIIRAGYAYIAVSAQQVGIEGGDNLVGADMSLKAQNRQRYSSLHHPGDQFSYDMYSQIGSLVRDGAVDGLTPRAVIAVGESQSAMFLTTYVNEVDPDAEVFDGFLVHSRFGPGAPLVGGSALEAIAPAPFRDDPRVPVLSVTPRQIWSTATCSAITTRVGPTTIGCGYGRSPVPPTPTTTRSASASSTTVRCRSRRSSRRTRRPTSSWGPAFRTRSTSDLSITMCCRVPLQP